MIRKNLFTSLFLVAMLLFAGVSIFAQTNTIAGKVVMKKEGGEKTPVKDVLIELVRVDAVAKTVETKTDETGAFSITEVTPGATYAISVSGSGIKPEIIPDVKPGTNNFEIPVTAGDSKRWSEEQVRLSVLTSLKESGTLNDAQKKMLEDYENKKGNVEKKNAIITQSLKDGNAAYNSGDYATAIAKYDEGINADPEFIGSAPVFLNNKGSALKKRAVEMYNAAVKSRDSAKINEAKNTAKKDLAGSLESYNKSYMLLTNAPAGSVSDQAAHKKNIFNAADGGRDAVRIMALIKLVDPNQAEAANRVVKAYMENESDKNKKGKAQAALASYLMDSNDYDGAVAEYRKAIEFTPDDPDVLAGFSLALYTAAEDKQSKPMKQESLNYMEKYLKVAPKNHRLRQDIDGLATYLKTEEKLKPQKIK